MTTGKTAVFTQYIVTMQTFMFLFLLSLSWYLQNNYAFTQYTIQKHASTKAKQATFVWPFQEVPHIRCTTLSLGELSQLPNTRNVTWTQNFWVTFSYSVQLIYTVFTWIKESIVTTNKSMSQLALQYFWCTGSEIHATATAIKTAKHIRLSKICFLPLHKALKRVLLYIFKISTTR